MFIHSFMFTCKNYINVAIYTRNYMNSYVISPNVHFSYEQKFLFARKLTQAVHKQGEENTFEIVEYVQSLWIICGSVF